MLIRESVHKSANKLLDTAAHIKRHCCMNRKGQSPNLDTGNLRRWNLH